MRKEIHDQVREIWFSIEQSERTQVVGQFRQTKKEMIDEHFRTSSTSTPRPKCDDLCQAIEPQPSAHKQRKPTHAVRAADQADSSSGVINAVNLKLDARDDPIPYELATVVRITTHGDS